MKKNIKKLRRKYPLEIGSENPILRTPAKKVTAFNTELKQLGEDILQMVYIYDGIGIAGPQIGVPQRIIAVGTLDENEQTIKHMTVMINPEITQKDIYASIHEEGCLSLPGDEGNVMRPDSIEYLYYDVYGNKHTGRANGYNAKIIQHEIDHLDGILFIDKMI